MADTNLASGTYTLSLNKISGSHTSGKVLWCDLFNGNTKVGNPWVRDDQTSKTFTINDSVNIIKLGFDPNDTFNNFTFNIQIEQGSTATEYQPYQSKDYEISLKSKNLFDINSITEGKFYYIDQSRIVDNANWNMSDYIKVNGNTNYIASYSGVGSSKEGKGSGYNLQQHFSVPLLWT